MVQKPDTIQDIFDLLDTEIRDSLKQLLNSNGEVNQIHHLNEEDFKKFHDKWFKCELKKSIVKATVVFKNSFPTDVPEKEFVIKTASDIMKYKVELLEKIIKEKISFL